MVIEQRELAPGTKLAGTYKKTTYVCEVVSTPEGETRFQLEDGRLFSSPSAAGKAVMNGVSCNGWRFWTRAGGEPPKAESAPTAPAAKTRKKPPAEPKPKTIVQIKKLRKQDGCAEGEVRWFCEACMDGFCLPRGETPTACPQGHPREAADELASPAGDAPEVSAES
jgi:Restriction Enzyme Adenine Methylase Associated